MPAKRAPKAKPPPTARARPSALAKQHNLSAPQEHEIAEAFSLFATAPTSAHPRGQLPTRDLRAALAALGVAPSSRAEHADFVSILDPDGEGAAAYDEFLAVAALKLHARADDDGARAAEVDEAFRLFAGGRSEGVITLGDLKRVAAVLKEDVDEAVLRDMVLEANAGAGVQVGVGRAEFEEVMRRAGAWK
ncbi:Caltractin like protein [Verticillium longisporum]|uniref:Caltractin like protein n=1 Tax=Verticillium longisporum TaxID=100787 RepID=A0A8I3ALW0_VERLO|nr:Caltractin like protein [Verticillium longisporum]KAG7127570.1 Caltractin like protein [Verticillium longisporum]